MRRPLTQKQRGQALTEFALVAPIFVLLLVGVFDLGRAVFAYNSITNAAREGARLAIVNQDTTAIKDRVIAQTSIAEADPSKITVAFYVEEADGTPASTPSDCRNVGCLVVVTYSSKFQPITPVISQLVFGSGVTFTAKSAQSIEFTCPNDTTAAADCPKQP